MSAPKSDTATIEARKFRLQELLAEGKTQREAAEILKGEEFPADVRTLRRDVTSLRGSGEKRI
jgi:DNA-binding CsgD family transcriptional regulator